MVSLKPYWEYALYIASQRQKQKEKYKSCLPLSENYELVGVLGELTYSILLGEDFNDTLLVNGDDGTDFSGGVNVKSSEEHKARHLIEMPDKPCPEVYVFCVVNLKRRYGKMRGWLYGTEFQMTYKKMDFGYGPRYAVELKKLNPFYTYPPLQKRFVGQMRFLCDSLAKNFEHNKD